MWRLLMAMALAAVVLSAVTASTSLLQVDGGILQVCTYPVDIEGSPPIDGCDGNCGHIESTATYPVDIEVPPPIDDCDDNCGGIESTAEDGGNPGEGRPIEYEIQPGDTLWAIAIRFDTSVETLVRLNQLQNPNLIFYGSTLNVPHVGEDAGDATADVSR
jgi:hypothetical protein